MPVCPTCERSLGPVRFCPYDGTPLAHIGSESRPQKLGPGDLVDGRYVIEGELGHGAVGVVYEARAKALNQAPVAIKVLKPELARSDRSLSRFAREARAASRIDHPNVVRVFDFGYAAEGFYFLVMELLQGRSLAELINEVGRFEPGRALLLLEQVASGLARAHELDVVHRDLKPENVMVRRGDGERVTLVDFGLSKTIGAVEGRGLTREGTLVGTPEYMSPEQWRGMKVDARTDVYAFGVMAYELLTGRLPLDGKTIVIKMQKAIGEKPVPLGDTHLVLPTGLSPLVMRCLEKDPDARPQDMRAVHRTLREILEEAEALESTDQYEMALPRMTTLVLADLGALSAASLVDEIERLRGVRRHRLKHVATTIQAPLGALVQQVQALELELEHHERERAIRNAALVDHRSRRGVEEAALREAMLSASLQVAVHRAGLPSDEPDRAPDLDSAAELLREAEAALSRFLSTPDRRLMELFDRSEEVTKAVQHHDAQLQELYDRLETEMRALPGGTEAASRLSRLDGAIAAYRAQLSRIRKS